MPVYPLNHPAQRSTFTLAEMVDNVLGDNAMRGGYVTSGDVRNWGNHYVAMAARETHFYTSSSQRTLSGNVTDYALPEGCIALQEAYYENQQLYLTTYEKLSRYWTNYRTSTGTPTYIYVRGASTFGVYPTPTSETATGTVTLVFAGLPPRVLNPQTKFYIPASCEHGIIAYCNYKLAMKDASNEGKARKQDYELEWREALADLKKQVAGCALGDLTIVGGDGLQRYDDLPWMGQMRIPEL